MTDPVARGARRGAVFGAAAALALGCAGAAAWATMTGRLSLEASELMGVLGFAGILALWAIAYQAVAVVRPARAASAEAVRALAAERAAALRREEDDKSRRSRAEAERKAAIVARDRARADASEKAGFLARISQEVRTPLTGIFGMAELMSETDLDDEQAAMIDTVRQSAGALERVIAGVMDFSKIESGDLKIETAPFDLREVAEQAISEVVPAARKKGLELVLDIAGDVPTAVRGDAGRVGQVLGAILDNAVKFTERGNVVLRLHAAQRSGRPFSAFEVIDTGTGISRDRIATVFEPFVQGGEGEDRRYGGTGLGLTIAGRLAEAMGGRIDVRSVRGRGSTFSVQIPLQLDRGAAEPRRRPVDLSGRRVLVVDDNAASRAVFLRRLGEWGAEAGAASTIEEVEDLLWAGEKGPPPCDLVLLDTTLADGDGMALAARLAERMPDLPVILLSGTGAVPGADAAGLSAGRLEKPVRNGALAAAIRQALSGAGPGRAATERSVTAAGSGRLSPSCIVLADDNATNRTLIEKFLAGEPMTLIHAPDGVGAIEAFRDWAPDLILMDVSMPNLDGLEATRRIRAMEVSEGDGARVPIIALTARALDEDRRRCLDAGMDDYVTKPIRKAELYDKIGQWTRARRESA